MDNYIQQLADEAVSKIKLIVEPTLKKKLKSKEFEKAIQFFCHAIFISDKSKMKEAFDYLKKKLFEDIPEFSLNNQLHIWVLESIMIASDKLNLTALALPVGMNTLNILELEMAFNRVVKANNGTIYSGIINGHITLEDSLPWFEIGFKEKSSIKQAKQFCQQLSDEMNIRILFNRIEDTTEFIVFGIMDIDYKEAKKASNIVPALSRDGSWATFMEDYGTPVLPTHTKTPSSKLKIQ